MLLLLLMMMMQCKHTCSAHAVYMHMQCICSAHAHACVTRKEAAEARESASPPFFHRALETVLTWVEVGVGGRG